MTVRSTFLAGNNFSGSTPDEFYTPPPDRTAIVRSLWIVSLVAGDRTFHLYWGGTSSINRQFSRIVPANTTLVVDSWWVINPETPVYVGVAGGTGSLSVMAFGALLLGAPE